MYTVQIDGTLTEAARFENAWTLAPSVWCPLGERFLDNRSAWHDAPDKLWALYKNPSLPQHWRTVLVSTFDHAIVEAERYAEMASDYRRFIADFSLHTSGFSGVAWRLDKLAAEDDPTTIGVCFYMSSVSENLWFPGDDAGDPVPYDIFNQDEHIYVYETVEAAQAPAEDDNNA